MQAGPSTSGSGCKRWKSGEKLTKTTTISRPSAMRTKNSSKKRLAKVCKISGSVVNAQVELSRRLSDDRNRSSSGSPPVAAPAPIETKKQSRESEKQKIDRSSGKSGSSNLRKSELAASERKLKRKSSKKPREDHPRSTRSRKSSSSSFSTTNDRRNEEIGELSRDFLIDEGTIPDFESDDENDNDADNNDNDEDEEEEEISSANTKKSKNQNQMGNQSSKTATKSSKKCSADSKQSRKRRRNSSSEKKRQAKFTKCSMHSDLESMGIPFHGIVANCDCSRFRKSSEESEASTSSDGRGMEEWKKSSAGRLEESPLSVGIQSSDENENDESDAPVLLSRSKTVAQTNAIGDTDPVQQRVNLKKGSKFANESDNNSRRFRAGSFFPVDFANPENLDGIVDFEANSVKND